MRVRMRHVADELQAGQNPLQSQIQAASSDNK